MNHCIYCEFENQKMIKKNGYGLSYIKPLSDCLDHGPKSHNCIGYIYKYPSDNDPSEITVKDRHKYEIDKLKNGNVLKLLMNDNTKKIVITKSQQTQEDILLHGFIHEPTYKIINESPAMHQSLLLSQEDQCF